MADGEKKLIRPRYGRISCWEADYNKRVTANHSKMNLTYIISVVRLISATFRQCVNTLCVVHVTTFMPILIKFPVTTDI